ncbi:MAG: hypothetical protein PVH80_02690 [Anaerolineae bacterium]
MNDRTRIILFWFTIALMLAVAILAAVTILRACGGLPTRTGPPPAITPPEISVCPGDRQQFAVEGDVEVSWEASGGTIDDQGMFAAGNMPGDYTVTATREDSGQAAGAIVHVVACTPTPTATPLPTALPMPTPTATLLPEDATTAAPSAASDAEGDVSSYETGAPVESWPTGIDIRAASVSPSLVVDLQPTESVPAELADWREEGEALFWISLYEAIPDPPPSYGNWLFVLDVDGDTETGRPVGSARINPDLGDEVALGVSYNTNTAAFEPYMLIWDTGNDQWATGPEMRYTLSVSRTVVGFALSLENLEGALSETTGITLTTEAVQGRAGAESYTAAGERVIDFYPNLPE